MPYQVSMMGWVGSGGDFCWLGWVQKFWIGLGFEKVTHDQLCLASVRVRPTYEKSRSDWAEKSVIGLPLKGH